MNKKGFVLVETLVVVIFVLLIFTILYNSAVPLLGRYKELSYYNDLDTTYDLYYLKKMVIRDANYSTITNSTNGYNILRCTNGTIDNYTECNKLFTALDIDTNDKLVFIDIQKLNKNNFENDSNISYEIKDYLKFIDVNFKILLLEHDGYISHIKLNEIDNYVVLSNLVNNGSFEDTSATGNFLRTYSFSTDKAYVGNRSILFTNTGTSYDTFNIYNVSLVSSHIYYGMEYVYTNSSISNGEFDVINNAGGGGSGPEYINYNLSNLTLNKWNKISGTFTFSGISPYIFRPIYTIVPATVYVDGCVLVDLTAAFGAGNEPNKEWCDANIDYFDGTTTVYK